ncbi:ribonuclease HI [Tsukamurella sp. 8F]|uniref:ribonuclease HI n=1 Tax=unclassified Tsukamurella TaxID=2633480 RepID=UPI0023B89ABC|nr:MULTISPECIES: ribonuclease HI [unclassified Tsukamurella]MDF0531912.1 ribonuclease HI [Tsukamurella sp. 8J]MDF0586948.1 ribonuclease HI [Tsukamurella sp. 8F]
MSEAIEIYTDGACLGNPGPGGWGAVLRFGSHQKELYGSESDTTNNRMELMGAISALEAINRPHPVVLHTDSSYVKNGITKWVAGWKRNGWKTADKKPVKNSELWQRLDSVASQYEIEWRWVKGHAGNEGNELADQLASKGAREARGG